MIKFLVTDRNVNAVPYATEREWSWLAVNRYGTPQKDDIRVVERFSEIFPVGGVMTLIRGPGFSESRYAKEFEALVELGAARWDEEPA